MARRTLAGPGCPGSARVETATSASAGSWVKVRDIERLPAKETRHFVRWFERKEPVILTGLDLDLAAWTPESIVSRWGENRVRICNHEGASDHDPMGWLHEVSIAEYFGRHFTAGQAMRIMGASLAQLEGRDDICQRLGLDAIRPPSLEQSRSLFFASASGGVVPLHFDVDFAHIFLVQAHGAREIRLFAPAQSRNLYKYPMRPQASVALDQPDFEQFPRLQRLEGHQCRLVAGEVLYMPARYWHLVEYTEPSCGMAIRFRKAGFEGRTLASYGKNVAALDLWLRSRSWGGAWSNLMKGMARL
ncbi:uncharacterized protein CMC5_047460 [Chondromyces crocatus]|nr:uncharacterized protein CMC5_047460 [Chondromyces crocatus]